MTKPTTENLVWMIAPDRVAHLCYANCEPWSLCGGVNPNTVSHWAVINRPRNQALRCCSCEHIERKAKQGHPPTGETDG